MAPTDPNQPCPPGAEALVDRLPRAARLADLDGLLERRRDDRAAPAALRALAVLAPGDDLAARTLLQALLPGLVRLAGTVGYDDPTAIEEMVSLAWERIRTYPAGRRGSVAANVSFDARKRYRAHRLIEAPRSPDTEIEVTATSRRPRTRPWPGPIRTAHGREARRASAARRRLRAGVAHTPGRRTAHRGRPEGEAPAVRARPTPLARRVPPAAATSGRFVGRNRAGVRSGRQRLRGDRAELFHPANDTTGRPLHRT